MSLEPITPSGAVDWYLEDRKEDWSYESQRTIQSALNVFLQWANGDDRDGGSRIGDMNDLTGRQIARFKTWRKNQGIEQVSLCGNLAILRRFLEFAEVIDAVERGTAEDVPMPHVSEEEEVRDDPPSDQEVDTVRENLEKYQYASRPHIEHELIRECSARSGAVRGIDIPDFRPEDNTIELHHRPEGNDVRGTPLKNKSDGERHINISPYLSKLIQDYLANPERPEGTDKYGREPLLTAEDNKGNVSRISVGRIRADFYKVTRPCEYTGTCPIGRDTSDCKVVKNRHASKCPENYTPHRLRSWSIMRQLDEGVRRDVLSNRVDVSVPTLKKHYDNRSKERKREQRLEELRNALTGFGDDSDQSRLNDFDGRTVVCHPALLPLTVGAKFGGWLSDRLRRELDSMSPDGELVVRDDLTKAAKGVAAYCLMILLLGINFVLAGADGLPFL